MRPCTLSSFNFIKFIELTRGAYAIVDESDFEWLNQWKWYLHSGGYAVRNGKRSEGVKGKVIYMHREILKPKEGMATDHIDGDRRFNSRINLRQCTQKQNAGNVAMNKKNTSGFRGVYFSTNSTGWWTARITMNGKIKHLGISKDPIVCAKMYDAAAKKHFGEFARLNFPAGV